MGQSIAHLRMKERTVDLCEENLEIQSAADHCIQAAKYSAENLAPIGLEKLGYTAALCHDAGKFREEFSHYIQARFLGRRDAGKVNHTFAGVKLLLEKYCLNEENSRRRLTGEVIASAVGSHHGLFDCVDENHTSGFKHRWDEKNLSYNQVKEQFFEECISEEQLDQLFSDSVKEVEILVDQLLDLRKQMNLTTSKYGEIDFCLGLLSRLVTSAVMDGDRRDTAEFMNRICYDKVRKNTEEVWKQSLTFMESKLNCLEQDSEIGRIRREISDMCKDSADVGGGIYRLNVPTGGGKTLSGLRFALTQAAKNHNRHIFFVMPLLSIIDQNAQVIRDFVGDDSVILEHHSNIVQESQSPDELNVHSMLCETWDAPIIITTLVQLLQTMFADKTSCIRRFHALTNSVIVIDEVQTVPRKMLSMFNMTLNFLAKCCGTTIVLCSATQPALEYLPHRLGMPIKDMVHLSEEQKQVFKRTEIIPLPARNLNEIGELILEKMESHRSILVICNLKSQAKTLYEELKDGDMNVIHLSAAMCTEHRRTQIMQMQTELNLIKEECSGNTSRKLICISTQVIEAGVDVSFECVIRLQAGLDSVVQAAGRCNRNHELEGLAPVYVLECKSEKLELLKDIRVDKSAFEELKIQMRLHPERLQNDYLSDEAIKSYYLSLYRNMKEESFDYPIEKKRGWSIWRLLSSNTLFADEKFQKSDDARWNRLLRQAFKTAGRLFKVFDTTTVDVIVPYGDGKDLIEDLLSMSEKSLAEQLELLRKARNYTVALYPYQSKKIEEINALIPIKNGKDIIAFALKEEHYDDDTGFVMEERQMPLYFE